MLINTCCFVCTFLSIIYLAAPSQERQQTDQPVPQQQSQPKPREKKLSESEQFGIDQNASFLSSGVVLDDLLKLKKPSTTQRGRLCAYAYCFNSLFCLALISAVADKSFALLGSRLLKFCNAFICVSHVAIHSQFVWFAL